MPFCPYCSHQVESNHVFCGGCGKALPAESSSHPEETPADHPPRTLPYRISPTRILVMSLLSYGIYLFYWFFLTWQQYRNYTGNMTFPMWHTLSILVPVYGQYRTHAHIRCINELMFEAGLDCSIKIGWAVALVAVIQTLGYASLFFNYVEVSPMSALISALLAVASIAIGLGLLLHVQQNLNRYWASLDDVTLVDLNVGSGEVILAVIGVITWIIAMASIVSPAFRAL